MHRRDSTALQDDPFGDESIAFLFCPARQATTKVLAQERFLNDDDSPNKSTNVIVVLGRFIPSQISLAQYAAMVLPGLVASHHGLLGGAAAGVAPACMPLPVLFSVPYVSPDSWLASKRARAFHRCCIICVYLQGGFALFKFARGDLIGGVYDAVQCAIGAYAIEPEGLRLMPSYIMMSGFNGLLGAMQVLQTYNGAPIHMLPMLAVLPPLVSLSAAYFGWQFVKEVQAIGSGMNGDGPQDGCFVSLMAGDWWPSSMGPSVSQAGVADPTGASETGPRSRFNPFAGDGHRLGAE